MYDNYDTNGKKTKENKKNKLKEDKDFNKMIEDDCFDNVYGSKIKVSK